MVEFRLANTKQIPAWTFPHTCSVDNARVVEETRCRGLRPETPVLCFCILTCIITVRKGELRGPVPSKLEVDSVTHIIKNPRLVTFTLVEL